MNITVKGQVVQVGTSVEFGNASKRLKRRVVVGVMNGKKTDPLPVDFYDRDVDMLEGLKPGDMCEVTFFCSGYENKAGNYLPSYVGQIIYPLK
jgi:hypothetical protein